MHVVFQDGFQKMCSACTGVIWRGDSVIDGVPETLDALRALVQSSFPTPLRSYTSQPSLTFGVVEPACSCHDPLCGRQWMARSPRNIDATPAASTKYYKRELTLLSMMLRERSSSL